MKQRTEQAGFTIVEMAVVVPILILIALAIFEALFMVVQSSDAERIAINLAYDKNVAMDEIEGDVRLAPLMVPQLDPNTAGQDPNESTSAPGGTWSYYGTGAGNRVLILREYSTSSNPLISGREPVFMGISGNPECNDPSVATNSIQTYNIVYFVKNGTLYRRRVTDSQPSHHTCTPQYQQTSCPTAAANCPADEVITNNVTAFDVHYYATGDPSATELTAVYDAPPNASLVSTARSVEVDLQLAKSDGGATEPSKISLRMATLNSDALGGS